MIVALLLDPFAIWQAQAEDPSLLHRPVVTLERGRVDLRSPEARRVGLARGLALANARLHAADLVALEPDEARLEIAWQGVLCDLLAFTPRLESRARGRALLELGYTDAPGLAEAYRARVGVAASHELALLAAVSAHRGQARLVPDGEEHAFLDRLPLRFLRGVGVSASLTGRLAWLGVDRVGTLARWRETQLRAFFGVEAGRVLPFLKGPWRRDVGRYHPPPSLRARLDFDDRIYEPWQLEPAILQLAQRLAEGLTGRSALQLRLDARVGALRFGATRLAKEPLRGAAAIARLAHLALRSALAEGGAAPLGLDALTLELSGLGRPSPQGWLWPHKEAHERAVAAVSRRFPGALLRIRHEDPYALASEHRLSFVDAASGERVRRLAAPGPRAGRDDPPESDLDIPVAA